METLGNIPSGCGMEFVSERTMLPIAHHHEPQNISFKDHYTFLKASIARIESGEYKFSNDVIKVAVLEVVREQFGERWELRDGGILHSKCSIEFDAVAGSEAEEVKRVRRMT